MKPQLVHIFNFDNFVSHADSVHGIVENIFLLVEVVRCQRDVILRLLVKLPLEMLFYTKVLREGHWDFHN